MKAPLGELFKELAAVSVVKPAAPQVQVQAPSPKPKVETAPPKEQAKPAKPQAKKKLPTLGVSIRGKAAKTEQEQTEQVERVEEPQLANVAINRADLEAKWRLFARAQENFTEQTLLSAMPRVEGDNKVIVTLQNSFQKKTIEDVQQTLIPYLRKELNNSSIMIDLEVSAALESTRAFTPHEKLKEMIKDHPDLSLLIERFNLEIE